jgi:hypothetical protein
VARLEASGRVGEWVGGGILVLIQKEREAKRNEERKKKEKLVDAFVSRVKETDK